MGHLSQAEGALKQMQASTDPETSRAWKMQAEASLATAEFELALL